MEQLILIGCLDVVIVCVECVGLKICSGVDFDLVNLENDLWYCDYW